MDTQVLAYTVAIPASPNWQSIDSMMGYFGSCSVGVCCYSLHRKTLPTTCPMSWKVDGGSVGPQRLIWAFSCLQLESNLAQQQQPCPVLKQCISLFNQNALMLYRRQLLEVNPDEWASCILIPVKSKRNKFNLTIQRVTDL